MSINLSCPVGAFDIPIEDLVDTLFNRRNELWTCVVDIHRTTNYFSGLYTLQLTDWHKVGNDMFLCMQGSFNVNDETYLTLRVIEGYKNEDDTISDTDAFLDIKTDVDSVTKALNDMVSGTIPLFNTDNVITEESCPYAVIYDDYDA